MKTILLVFGTRPEAIKMAPLVAELRTRPSFRTLVCVTGQHREMLDAVLHAFEIRPDYDLSIMKEGQTLSDITSAVLTGMGAVLDETHPDLLLVHGDTTTALAAALAAFYRKIPVGHVEAGLRTGDLSAPYPEEFNRVTIDTIAEALFAPTTHAGENLRREGKPESHIFVTGNTVVDALRTTVKQDYTHPVLEMLAGRRMILMTAHRRENIGAPMARMFSAVRRFAEEEPDVVIVYPVHPNPAVKTAACEKLGGLSNVLLISPLDVFDFHNLMARATLVLTDSGGAQEEAPFFGVPVLVMRDTTERPEGIEAGTACLVGTDEEKIFSTLKTLLHDHAAYDAMAHAASPYGDGFAAKRIADILEK